MVFLCGCCLQASAFARRLCGKWGGTSQYAAKDRAKVTSGDYLSATLFTFAGVTASLYFPVVAFCLGEDALADEARIFNPYRAMSDALPAEALIPAKSTDPTCAHDLYHCAASTGTGTGVGSKSTQGEEFGQPQPKDAPHVSSNFAIDQTPAAKVESSNTVADIIVKKFVELEGVVVFVDDDFFMRYKIHNNERCILL